MVTSENITLAVIVTAGPNETVDVTARARILKGTAVSDTTIDATLTIEAEGATGVIDTNTSSPISLAVGRGGNGDTLTLNTRAATAISLPSTRRSTGRTATVIPARKRDRSARSASSRRIDCLSESRALSRFHPRFGPN